MLYFILLTLPHTRTQTEGRTKKKSNWPKNIGSKHSSQIEGSHAILIVVALHESEEVA